MQDKYKNIVKKQSQKIFLTSLMVMPWFVVLIFQSSRETIPFAVKISLVFAYKIQMFIRIIKAILKFCSTNRFCK